MKKFIISVFCACILLIIMGCCAVKTLDTKAPDTPQASYYPEISKHPIPTQSADIAVTWDEITQNGVDEQALLDNIDTDALKKIANLLQDLDTQIAQKENASADYVLRGQWLPDILNSEQYNEVISMGNKAMKPLYLIIYKSDNQGRYEYICALALEQLSGFEFETDPDSGAKWSISKEFLEEFNKKILENRQ